MRSLGLLSIAHAVNHAQAVMLPLIFLAIIDEYGVSVGVIAFLAAVGSFASGMAQLSYAGLTRVVSRRRLLGIGGIIFGGGFALQALRRSASLTFAVPNIASRIGGSPQHPVGNGLLSEQFPPERRGFAISAHIAGGNVGTVIVALIGVPLIAGGRLARGVDRVRPAGDRRSPSRSCCSSASAARTGPRPRPAAPSGRPSGGSCATSDLRWLYLTAVLGGGGRGLGVVNLFVLIYLTQVIGLDAATTGLMYGVLIVFAVPDARSSRAGCPTGSGASRSSSACTSVGRSGSSSSSWPGDSIVWLWAGILLMGLFSFAESPQLQALLADIAPVSIRDAIVRAVLHDGLRRRVAVGRALRRGHRAGRRGDRGADRVRADGRHVRAGGHRDACRSTPSAARRRTSPRGQA